MPQRNIAGRIAWASASDVLGRKLTYTIFFLLGFALYVSAPIAGQAGRMGFFVVIFCVILTMYGGGFATVPACLADPFGTQHVGAIHGRLLTAWSVAGMLLLGLICNLLIRPVDSKHHMTEEQIAKERATSHASSSNPAAAAASNLTPAAASHRGLLVLAWTAVAVPLAWGGWITLSKSLVLFK